MCFNVGDANESQGDDSLEGGNSRHTQSVTPDDGYDTFTDQDAHPQRVEGSYWVAVLD